MGNCLEAAGKAAEVFRSRSRESCNGVAVEGRFIAVKAASPHSLDSIADRHDGGELAKMFNAERGSMRTLP